MNRFIGPLEGNAFTGEPLFRFLKKSLPGPRDWSPRGEAGIKR